MTIVATIVMAMVVIGMISGWRRCWFPRRKRCVFRVLSSRSRWLCRKEGAARGNAEGLHGPEEATHKAARFRGRKTEERGKVEVIFRNISPHSTDSIAWPPKAHQQLQEFFHRDKGKDQYSGHFADSHAPPLYFPNETCEKRGRVVLLPIFPGNGRIVA